MPTTRSLPPTIAAAKELYDRGDVLAEETRVGGWKSAVFDLTGQPAISIPCGLTSEGLPVGLMLVARQWDEGTLLRAARAYELVRGSFPNPPV